MVNRNIDILKQGFMKPRRVKRTYNVGIQSAGYVNTRISSKAEAIKVAASYTKLQYDSSKPCAYTYMQGADYIWVSDNEGNTVAAWRLQVHKWTRVI